MKNLIFILAVLTLLSCKKESFTPDVPLRVLTITGYLKSNPKEIAGNRVQLYKNEQQFKDYFSTGTALPLYTQELPAHFENIPTGTYFLYISPGVSSLMDIKMYYTYESKENFTKLDVYFEKNPNYGMR